MYRGIARLLGMKVLASGPSFSNVVDEMIANYDDHDFFFIHYKGADTAGEDGNFEAKVRALEEVDAPSKKSSTSTLTFSSSPETTRLPLSGQTTAGTPYPS